MTRLEDFPQLRLGLRVLLIILASAACWVAFVELYVEDMFLSPVRVLFFLTPVVLIGLGSLVLLPCRPTVQLMALIYGFSLALGVYGAELYLEARHSRSGEAEWTPWRPAAGVRLPHVCGKYVMMLNDDGAVHSALTWQGKEIQPLTGIARNALGGDRESDRHGFNNPPGQWEGSPRALAVGDSFAFGVGVESGRSFVDLIREGVGPTVNLGCSWNGPLLELASLVEYGRTVRAQMILWYFYEGNDLLDLEIERHSPMLMRYLERGFKQGLVDNQHELDRLLTEFSVDRIERRGQTPAAHSRSLAYVVYGDPRKSAAIDWDQVLVLQNLKWSQGLVDLGQERSTFPLLRDVLDRAAETSRELNGTLWFIYLPSERRFSNSLARAEADSYRGRVLHEVADLGIQVIDLTPHFERHPRPLELFDGHYSEAGNALVADVTLRAIDAREPAE